MILAYVCTWIIIISEPPIAYVYKIQWETNEIERVTMCYIVTSWYQMSRDKNLSRSR